MAVDPSNHRRNTEAGVKVIVESDGFRLKATGNIKQGDTLLIAYETSSGQWQKISVEFHDQPGGMFVFTGQKPRNIVVLSKRALERANHLSEVPTSSYSSDSSIDLLNPANLFSPLNTLSPFHPLNQFDPLGFLHHWGSNSENDSGRGTSFGNTTENGNDGLGRGFNDITMPPGGDPFDQKNVELDGAFGGGEKEGVSGFGGEESAGFGASTGPDSESGFSSSLQEPSAYP
jgi:hypothetical protein